MGVVKLKRSQSNFQIVTTAGKIYTLILKLCLKMPKRYTYLVLQSIIDRADKLCYYTRGSKVDQPLNIKQAQIKMSYLIHAAAALDDLSGKVDFFISNPNGLTYRDEEKGKVKGITYQNLEEVSTLINQERELIEQEKIKTRKQFPNLVENKILRETYYIE